MVSAFVESSPQWRDKPLSIKLEQRPYRDSSWEGKQSAPESDCQINQDLSFLLAAIFSKEWMDLESQILIYFNLFLWPDGLTNKYFLNLFENGQTSMNWDLTKSKTVIYFSQGLLHLKTFLPYRTKSAVVLPSLGSFTSFFFLIFESRVCSFFFRCKNVVPLNYWTLSV